ncbi:pentatricopeptide repeat-containing protein At3g09650, chloroplastic [Dioscorea cayenensis subsp. rotundata]|uniref:Pentatricopeptide repeat-containing protein At3g09650, chloroplastic n=1 Tax=Dioscorea cayennensis subsp. rotundata TaxID=55577 RepID=A0AB40BX61_DIOCR|nr:pentatricopeptide repeat-containing protein At3g09650, chloroplastic [Dioscorea cayenensis subsp. rotundata]
MMMMMMHHLPSIPSSILPSSSSFKPLNSSSSSSIPITTNNNNNNITESQLLSLLRQNKTDEAYSAYLRCTHLPGSIPLSRLLAQLSYQPSPSSLSRALSIVRRLRSSNQLHRLDSNSLGLLAVASSRSGNLRFALSLIHFILRSGFLPHVKAWSAVAARLASSPDDGPSSALRLFDSILHRLRSLPSPLSSDSLPDTAAFNAALNAAANLGDIPKFLNLFDEMPHFSARPDILTHNILIKLCARAERRDLLPLVLIRIIRSKLVPCITTLHSLVAAYVGLGDLNTAELLVQAMRDGRADIPAILSSASHAHNLFDEFPGETHRHLEKLVMNFEHKDDDGDDPPLMPKTYKPDSRIYTTLMKGYMNKGHVDDVVRMITAMQRENDPASHPDHVTYTTVISALMKAGEMDRARKVLDEMSIAGVPANRVTYNVLLKGYCQKLQLDKAKELAKEMLERKGLEPNVVSYNILIDGCILLDDSAGALAYFNEMRERGIAPSKVSYTTLMKAFALSGQPKLAHQVFDEMAKDKRVKVDRVAWNMLVEGYCRLGLIEDGKRVVEKMKESGLQPDVATYGSLANGIALARKPGEALLLWNEVKERREGSPALKPDEGLLDALADVCVRAAFFKKALEIVACMEECGILPNRAKYKRIYVEMHSRMFTSKHASRARQDRRAERKRAAEAFKFWLGLPNEYYGSEWRLEPLNGDGAVDEFEFGDSSES